MRSSAFLPLLLAALAMPLCAQPEKLAGVSGVVVNSVTGAPLPRAHVRLSLESEDQSYGAIAAADGKFSITSMPPGTYSVDADRIGFSMPPGNFPSLVLQPGGSKDDLRIALVPAGSISGRVTTADGKPAEGVSVTAESDAGIPSDIAAATGPQGQFRIGGLAPGKYRVLATPENPHTPPEQRTDGSVDVQDAPTYYPSALHFRQASQTSVAPGAETSGIGIQLVRVPIVEVSGTAGNAPQGAFNPRIFIAPEGGGGRSAPAIKPDGTFHLWRLDPGKYEVTAMWQAPGGRDFVSAPADFEVAGANIENLKLRLVPPVDVVGRIEYQDDRARPAPGSITKLTLIDAGIRGGVITADIAADGSFQIRQLPAGRYRLGLTWPGVYVASAQLGKLASDGSLLDLTSGASGELSVRASSATGSVSGNVAGADGPASGAQVALIFDGAGVFPRLAGTAADGTYSFRNVAPGRYRILAVPKAEGDALARRAQNYLDLMESIEVQPGSHLTQSLNLRDLR